MICFCSSANISILSVLPSNILSTLRTSRAAFGRGLLSPLTFELIYGKMKLEA
jgi:hypothetical protein